MSTTKPKRLPVGFGPIDPQATWDTERFLTALAATGHDISVLYSDDDKLSIIMMDACFPKNKTRLQAGRFANLVAWERNKDPKRHRQYSYVRDLVGVLRFAPRTEADGVGPRYVCLSLG
jgi:hypothetical protein